jgi:hypothetical protein
MGLRYHGRFSNRHDFRRIITIIRQGLCVLRGIDTLDDLRIHLLSEELLAKGTKKVWPHKDIEMHLLEEPVLHQIKLLIAEDRKKLH